MGVQVMERHTHQDFGQRVIGHVGELCTVEFGDDELGRRKGSGLDGLVWMDCID